MRKGRRLHFCIPFLLVLAPCLISQPAAAQLEDAGNGLLVDSARGLTWMADSRHVVSSGLAESIVMPRTEALAALAAINRGDVENYGYGDWRLPTARELSGLLEAQSAEVRVLTGADPHAILAAASAAGLGRSLVAGSAEPVVLWPVRGNLIPAGFAEVVILATNSARIKNQAVVVSGDVVVNDASAGPTLADGFELSLDPRSATSETSTLSADSLQVKNNAVVAGDVEYNDLVEKGDILGSHTTPLALPVFPLLPPFLSQAPAPGSPDVDVPNGGAAVLAGGDYGAVTVGKDAVLLLSGGVYDVASIEIAKGGELRFGGASEVRVEGRFGSAKDAVIAPADGSGVAASEIVVYVAGINGTDGALDSTPRATEFGPDNLVAASFYAPNGTLRMDHGTDATGAFLARDVLVENRSTVALASFFFNRPPVAEDDSATVDEGGTVSVLDSGEASVLANDSDPNGDALTVALVSGPDHGTLTLNADGTFSYTHDGSETTSDSFVYEACDDSFPTLCDMATVSITVNPVNDPPVAGDDSASVDQGGTTTVLDSGATSVLANDTDVDSINLTVTTTPVSGPANGTLTLNADGTFSYTHDGSETESDSFVYEVCDDGTPVECDTATVSITIRLPLQLTVTPFGLGTGTVTSSPAGINCGVNCVGDFLSGSVVTLTATADSGSTFAGFSGDADCTDGVVTMAVNTFCQARFDLAGNTADLTVSLAGTGSGSVTSSPAGIVCPGDCSETYAVPTRVTLTATADEGSTFVGWTGDADCSDGVIALASNTSCTAVFDLEPATISITKVGLGTGTVTSTPAGINCGSTCSATFTPGDLVTLTATADAGSAFNGFSGDADCADGVVTASGATSCFARFDLDVAPATVTVTLAGTGSGTVTSSPAGINCPGDCSEGYPIPSQVFLTATADAGSVFVGWSGDADCSDGALRLSGDANCTATFNAVVVVEHTLTVVFVGAGSGTVSVTPPGITCTSDCSATLTDGTLVNLSVRPSSGTFLGWGGDCSGTGFSTSVLMDADKTCTVTIN